MKTKQQDNSMARNHFSLLNRHHQPVCILSLYRKSSGYWGTLQEDHSLLWHINLKQTIIKWMPLVYVNMNYWLTALINELADMMTATGAGGDLWLRPVKNVMKLTIISKMLKRREGKKCIQMIWNKTDLWKSIRKSIAERPFENNTGNKECVNENTIRYERLFEASPSVNLSVWISAHSIPLMLRALSIARVAKSNCYRLRPHI